MVGGSNQLADCTGSGWATVPGHFKCRIVRREPGRCRLRGPVAGEHRRLRRWELVAPALTVSTP